MGFPNIPAVTTELTAILQYGTSFESLMEWLGQQMTFAAGQLAKAHDQQVINHKAMYGTTTIVTTSHYGIEMSPLQTTLLEVYQRTWHISQEIAQRQ